MCVWVVIGIEKGGCSDWIGKKNLVCEEEVIFFVCKWFRFVCVDCIRY